jgi:transposase InsO family protein
MPHFVNCAKCVKKHKDQIDLLTDNGASLHFTNQRSDLGEYEVVDDKDSTIYTASAGPPLTVVGHGSIYLTTSGIHRKEAGRVIHLYPVFYVKGLTHKFLSVGALLNLGFELRGSSSKVEFRTHKSNQLEFLCEPHEPGQNLYWLSATLVHADSLLASIMVSSIDYDIMHRCFAHPSMDVRQHTSGNTQGFPNILIPRENPICPGCAEGKMTHSSFPPSDQWSTKPFDKVHMDLKSMPTCPYCGYNFSLILFDDCTSHDWTVNLKHKSNANLAIGQFFAKIKTQYRKTIQEFQIDAGGEFKSTELTEFLKELGVNILTSVPHMHQQNGCAERFIRTIMDKSQAMHLESCAPQSWWKFSVDCAVHVYNCTPIMRHNWKTPFENLEHTKPNVTHLRVCGCSTYIFLPEEVHHNKLNPKSELMTFIGYPQKTKGYLFMRSLNNVLFTAIQALFNETLYLKCPDMCHPGYTPALDPPVGKQGEYNTPPNDDELGGNGGGPLPPFGPAGGPRPQLPPCQPPQQGYLP